MNKQQAPVNFDAIMESVIDDAETNEVVNSSLKIGIGETPHVLSRHGIPSRIVINSTMTNRIEDVIRFFGNRESKTSTHYLIGRDGRLIRFVDDDKSSMFLGPLSRMVRSKIDECISIHLVGEIGTKFTTEQYKSCAQVCANLIRDREIHPVGITSCEQFINELIILGLVPENVMAQDSGPGEMFTWKRLHDLVTMELLESRFESSVDECEPSVEDDDINSSKMYEPQVPAKMSYRLPKMSILKRMMLSIWE